jgi:amino acid transporter
MSEISSDKVPAGVFARTSSGLVRTVSTFDTFFYNLVQLGVAFAFFNVAYWFLYPGSNMETSTIVALVIALLEGVTYGLFASVYPRSGGEYVPLSRATHPFIGFVGGFNNTLWQCFWTGTTAQYAISMGLAPLLITLGLQTNSDALFDLGVSLDSSWGLFIAGMIVIAGSAYILNRGMSVYFKIQKYLFSIGLACFLVLIIVLLLGSTGTFDFQASYAKYFGSGAYSELLEAARAEGVDLNPISNGKMTLWFMIWPAYSFFFAVLSTSFSGEIKDVKRGQLIGIAGSQIVGGILVLLIGLLSRTAFSKEGVLAIGVVSDAGNFPLPYPWVSMIASIMADNVLLTIIINVGVFLLVAFMTASTIIYGSRGMLAFGIDGMAPEWVGKVSKKYHTPTNAIIVNTVIGLSILVIYSFTDWLHTIQGMAATGLVFMVTTLAAAFFPYTKRETYEASPARIEVFGIPVMTITGLLGSAGLGYVIYRLLVDPQYGVDIATNPFAFYVSVGVFVVGAIWYFIARAIRRGQGVDMDARFREIPIE